MRSLLLQLFLLGCFAHMGSAQATSAQASGKSAPQLDHFDPKKVDTSVDPCTDFYQYSCNRWIEKNPVPADEVFWGVLRKAAVVERVFSPPDSTRYGSQSRPAQRTPVEAEGWRLLVRVHRSEAEKCNCSLHFAAAVAPHRSHVQQESDRRHRRRSASLDSRRLESCRSRNLCGHVWLWRAARTSTTPLM